MRMKKQNKPVILSLVLERPAFNLKNCARAKERCAFSSSPNPVKFLLSFLRTKIIFWVMQEIVTELLCSLGQIAFLTHM